MDGRATTFDIFPEWGLNLYRDSEENFASQPDMHAIRQTELLVIERVHNEGLRHRPERQERVSIPLLGWDPMVQEQFRLDALECA